MFLPLQNKPESSGEYANHIVGIPNVIPKEVAIELKEFALNENISGWHRRGSKSSDSIKASFSTCLIFQHNTSAYEVLDKAWEQYCNIKKTKLDFIEPYEIKSYITGDRFGWHSDITISTDNVVEKKINLIVQLSDEQDYEGGDLYVGKTKCPREFGFGIFFPSKFLHCVSDVTNGERFSLVGHAWGPVN